MKSTFFILDVRQHAWGVVHLWFRGVVGFRGLDGFRALRLAIFALGFRVCRCAFAVFEEVVYTHVSAQSFLIVKPTHGNGALEGYGNKT